MPYAHYGNPQSLNLYGYVQNNPTTFGDPDGHEVDFDKNSKKGKKLLLTNVSKAERKMFQVTKNKDGKSVLSLKAGADTKFKGEHTSGYGRLTTAINSDKVETINVSKTYTDRQYYDWWINALSVFVSREIPLLIQCTKETDMEGGFAIHGHRVQRSDISSPIQH